MVSPESGRADIFYLWIHSSLSKHSCPLSLNMLLEHCSHFCFLIMCHLSHSYWNSLSTAAIFIYTKARYGDFTNLFNFLSLISSYTIKIRCISFIPKYSPNFLGRLHPQGKEKSLPRAEFKASKFYIQLILK